MPDLTNKVTLKSSWYFLALILTLLVSGCGGSSSDKTVADTQTAPEPKNVVTVVARTGAIAGVRVGETVNLDGSKSFISNTYPNFTSSSAPLSYDWSFSSKPASSQAQIQNATTANPSFVADTRGVYMVQLVVNADGHTSKRDVKSVIATVDPEELTGPFHHQGLSSNCMNCHNGDLDLVPGVSKIKGKSFTHMATSKACETCHTPQGFSIIPFVDHQEVFGQCSECHNGVIAIGKSEFHSQTDAECDECHSTSGFIALAADGSYDHSNVTNRCIICHNSNVAIGKPEQHIETTAECGNCHTTDSFTGAYPDHAGPEVVGKRCDSCHNGSIATGPFNGHPQVNVDCAVCHSVVKFSLDGVFNHELVDPAVQPCQSCHNDTNSINALSKSSSANHPVTSADCGTCHNTVSFTDAFVDHTTAEVLNARCDSCHGVNAKGKPPQGHLPTTEDCGVCHTPGGSFKGGTFDHAGVVDNCESCHNNVISIGKLSNHLPTTADCSTCHNTTSFAAATFNHSGIVDNCQSCHNGNISLGKPDNHVPTVLDCSSCHNINDFTTFAGITFNHLGIDNTNCASCHNTGIATPKPANHIPAQTECSGCHQSTDTFAVSSFLTAVHQDLTRGCEGCHTAFFFPTKPNVIKSSTHVPTLQDCHLCHTVTAFKPSTFSHLEITGNCVSCHDGSTNNVAAGAVGKTDIPIHQNTNSDCSVCHNKTSFASAFIDHSGPDIAGQRCDSCHNGTIATGKDAKTNPPHVATTEDCGTCHTAGSSFTPAIFNHVGIVDNCASCHNGTTATGLSQNHIPVAANQDCSLCHNTSAFAGATFDHQFVVDSCSTCHNGTTAHGKIPPPGHVPTNQDCIVCHQTTGFIPATFDHTGIVDNCSACHGAGFATDKPITHIPTSQDCGVCHNTKGFKPATFDHTGIVDNCASCHDGTTARGFSANHLTTSLDCHFCHTTATFVGGSWVHDATTAGQCDSCHNNTGGGASGKPQNHLSTNVQCDVCHTTNGWAPTVFKHDPNGNYPGDHRRDPGCSGCHGNIIDSTFSYPSPQYSPFCAACHENNFRRKDKHIGGKNGTVAQNMDCSNGGRGCHRVSDRNFGD